MAARFKPDEDSDNEDFVEVPAHGGGPPPYRQVYPETMNSVLRDMRDCMREMKTEMKSMKTEMKSMKENMGKMETELHHIKYNEAKNCITEILQTKEFAESMASCIDSDGNFSYNKFVRMVEGAVGTEPRGQAALVGRKMREYNLSQSDLEEILIEALKTFEPPKNGWSGWKKGCVIGMGLGAVVFVLVAILCPLALGGAVVTGITAVILGFGSSGSAMLMK